MVRGPVSLVIVGIATLAMFALVIGGPRTFESILPESAIVWLETMGGRSGAGGMMATGGDGGWMQAATASDTPGDLLADTSDGWAAQGPIAAVPGGAVFIDQALAGYSVRVRGQVPARTEALLPLQGCAPTPPGAGVAVLHAGAASSDRVPLGVLTYGDADLARGVQAFARAYRRTVAPPRIGAEGLAFGVQDVAVTETEKPVYLVLEAPAGKVIFNIHLAPGARLDRVVLIGGEQVGVANVAPEVPVEVMRQAELAACGMQPFYPLNPNHLFYQSVEMGVIQGEELAQKQAGFQLAAANWDAAFRALFGVGAAETLAGGWLRGSVSAVGPVPATAQGRAVWQPVSGGLMRLTLDQYVDLAVPGGENIDFAARVRAIATAFAGGDLASLKAGVQF
ncbi:hypothetical protein [Fuscovulum blasticum]|uniref:hypothetical protein n=1 Tax=Fuscovulum blasticum TaxID=1075 RepID=UPI000D3E720D|nr:hypothetical protein [Fuscovulum blasticum]AWD22907.1 hypothetical protein B6K69_15480 [Fuscovulum blasticum]